MIAWLAFQFVIYWFAVSWIYVCPQKNSAKPVSKPLQTVKFYTIFTIRYCIVYSIPFSKIPDQTTDRKHYDDSKE